MNETATELAREAEAARERVADTAETIRRKLTAGQLFDEFTDMFTGGDVSGAVGNLKAQVRDNPMPAVLVGIGLAWLAFGKGIGGQHQNSSVHSASTPGSGASPHPPRSGSGGTGSSVMDTVSDGAGLVADGAKAAASSVSGSVGSVVNSLTDTAGRLRHSMPPHMPRSISNLASQEPLLVAAAGVAIGAMIGAMLPATELEKEQLGPGAGRLREKASDMVEKGRESASRVASKAYDAAKEEADRQGLTPGDGSSLGERVGEVVRSAAEAVEDNARHEMGVDHEGTTQRS